MRTTLEFTLLVATLLVMAESARGQSSSPAGFSGYWFGGEAEINRFELEQARYGERHPGSAVLIFVTEDFLPRKQVKADSSDRTATGAWPVLKLNFTRKFLTGIYPYSAMTSVFTPVDIGDHPRTLKTTTTMQEWCGHVFTQMNLRDDHYRVQTFSYFESEGDQEFDLDAVWLEDEVWSRIRIDPGSLPVGKIRIIPGGQTQRFTHRPFLVESAEAVRETDGDGNMVYRLSYPELGRQLSIRYQKAFPHRIEGWEERDGERGPTTRAVRTHTLKDAYWKHNSAGDTALRRKLGL